MRVLFITLYNPENYGVRCLASQLLAHGHTVHILQLKNHMQQVSTQPPAQEPMLLAYANGSLAITDLEVRPITLKERTLFAEAVATWKPEVIAFSIFGVHQKIFPLVSNIAAQAQPQAFLAAGGVGPTLDPEFFLCNGAHAALRGEGEDALLKLLQALENGLPWKNCPNIAYLEDGILQKTPMLPLSSDLSQYPTPLHDDTYYSCIEDNAWQHVPMDKCVDQKNPIRKDGEGTCLTSRGCLGACSYCSAESLRRVYLDEYPHSPKLRMRSLDHIFKELHDLKRHGKKYIYFYDDFFVRPKKIMHEFLERYQKEIQLPFFAFFHPQQLAQDSTLISHAIKAGCQSFTFGIQSGSREFCRTVYARKFFSNDYAKLFSDITNLGGDITIQFLGGNPLESSSCFQESLDFCKLLPFDASQKTVTAINVFYLMFFPGAKLAQRFPQIRALPRSMEDFYYKSLLLDIRRMTSDNEFENIATETTFKKEPGKLRSLRSLLIHDLQQAYLHEQIHRLNGREVYFWGAGELYLYKKHLFSSCKVKKILIDEGYDMPTFINGIPTSRPSDALSKGPILPIIIFSQHARKIYQCIIKKYPEYNDVILCTKL